MKNQDENTTIIQFSYRTFTIFKTFLFIWPEKILLLKKPHLEGLFKIMSEQHNTI